MIRGLHGRVLLVSRIACALAMIVSFALLSPRAAAAQDAALPTRVIIKPLAPVTVGSPVTVSAQLTTASGEGSGALGNEVLELWVDGKPERRARTDTQGRADIRISAELPLGAHTVRVVYPGSRSLAGSEAATTVTVEPVVLTIQTVPPLAGITFRLGEATTFQSGPDGIARVDVDAPGTYPLTVLTTDVKTLDTHAVFGRWADDQYTAARQVDIPQDALLQAGFNVSYRITWSYVDLDGSPVDPSRASSMTVKGTHGSSHVFKEYEPQWLLGSRVVRLQGGLQEAKIQWGVESVIVDGANTVNRGQHRFFVAPGDSWQIQLLLYTANLSARDAFFGFPVGSGFNLEYPDGQVRYFPSGPSKKVTAAALARGQYGASIADAPGIAPAAPVAVTRHQDVQLKVISYFDLAVAGFALGSIGLGLLFFGRPHLLAWVPTPLRRRNGRMAPLWTTGVLLLVMIGVPTLTTSYLLTVGVPDGEISVIPAMTNAGDSASVSAAILAPFPGELGSAGTQQKAGEDAVDGRSP